MLRHSSLFEFKHGDHACIFYRSEDKLLELLTPYFADGLRKGECCFGVQKSRTIKRLFNDLRFLGIEPDDEMERGALVMHTDDTGYLTNGKFEPDRMMEMLLNTISDCVKRGFSGFRSAGDLSWAARGRQDCNQVIGYEQMVEKSYPGKPALGFCQYHVRRIPPAGPTGFALHAGSSPGDDLSHGAGSVAVHPANQIAIERCATHRRR